MTADLSASDPRAYIRLAVQLRKEIAEGELGPGDRAPSVTALALETRHARQTCAKALVLLADEGLLYRVPGLGYLVTRDARRWLGE